MPMVGTHITPVLQNEAPGEGVEEGVAVMGGQERPQGEPRLWIYCRYYDVILVEFVGPMRWFPQHFLGSLHLNHSVSWDHLTCHGDLNSFNLTSDL